MTNIQSFDRFVSSGMKSEGFKPAKERSDIKRIGPHRLPGKPGKIRPVQPPSKPKPDRVNQPLFQMGGKVNEFLNVPESFEKARKNINELSDYLLMSKDDLCNIIYNGINLSDDFTKNTKDKIITLAYSYGLI